jgi:histidyl-tRNA synthetase
MYKIAKGTQDLVGDSYNRLQDLIALVEKEFKAAGGTPLETPVFERSDVLLNKYGDEAESKLIYRIAENGGEDLSLRYDLTVPFVRYLKESGTQTMRRYSIGKVYRRDQPNIRSGRFREFYQADFDIFGERQEGMLAEATLLGMVSRVLNTLGLDFKILINDVRNLEYLLRDLGIEEWRKYCPAIDKLDKQSFASLIPELQQAGLTADQIATLEERLKIPTPLLAASSADFDTLCALAEIFGFRDNIVFTNSLARGLDYYTGFIWEFKLSGDLCGGSTISAGGRYDGLMKKPAVGISVGLSRLSTVLPTPPPVWKEAYYVTTVGSVSIMDKMRVVKKIQDSVACPVLYALTTEDRKLVKVLGDCASNYIRYVVIVGDTELASGQFVVKDIKERTQQTLAL